MNINSPIASGGRIFKTYSGRLEKLNIFTFKDFLYHIPSRYDDFSRITTIAEAVIGETVSLQVTVMSMKSTYARSRMTFQKAIATDGTGTVEITWFNQPYLAKQIKTNDILSIAGRLEKTKTGNKLVMSAPEFEVVSGESSKKIHTANLVPVYHETRGISSKWLRRQIYKLLFEEAELPPDILPESIRERFQFIDLQTALRLIHFQCKFLE